MTPAVYTFVTAVLMQHPIAPGLTVEIGGRTLNGSVRPLFPQPYVSIDLVEGPGVDLVADGATWHPRGPVTCVVCCGVLEHTPRGAAICRNAFRMLAPHGLLILTAAGLGHEPESDLTGGPLGDGEYYEAVETAMLVRWLRDFTDIAIIEETGLHDIYALARKGTSEE